MFGKKKKNNVDTGWIYQVVEGKREEFVKALNGFSEKGFVMSNGSVIRTVTPENEVLYTHIICMFINPNPTSEEKNKKLDTGWDYQLVEGEKEDFANQLNGSAKEGFIMSNGAGVRTVTPENKVLYTHIMCRFTNPNPDPAVRPIGN